ncbi:MAG TPA: 50S ribosomal protein L13 [Candidatus Paceibacterota bacterium]|nr:50S ribosomal protein L13 [Candidatus Paceibacterota bacterium]
MEYTLDATNQSLGRLAAKTATLLRGKHLPTWEPHKTPDVKVTVENLEKVRFTGNKMQTVKFHRYSGYPGGLHSRTLEEAWAKSPREVFRKSVMGMLPDNRTRSVIIKNLNFK